MRRAFVLFGLLMMGLVALPVSRAPAADLEKLRVSIIPIGDVAPLFAAVQNGYFRELGLEIDTTPSAGGAAGIPGLIGGSFDIAYGNVVSALLAVQQGLDVKVVAPGTNLADPALDASPILVKSDSGIKTGKDLEGKSIAVNTRNNVIWLYARAWVKATGGDPERVTFKEVPFPQMEDALRQQRVDAAFMVAPFSIVASQKGGLTKIGNPYSQVQPGVDVGQREQRRHRAEELRFGLATLAGTYRDALAGGSSEAAAIIAGLQAIDAAAEALGRNPNETLLLQSLLLRLPSLG
jgi:NitT/TauT family transport system substrate-binding protein